MFVVLHDNDTQFGMLNYFMSDDNDGKGNFKCVGIHGVVFVNLDTYKLTVLALRGHSMWRLSKLKTVIGVNMGL